MRVKKIEESNYYELFNLNTNATKEEIEKAYIIATAIYSHDSLASYGFFSPKERNFASERVEDAYRTLSDPVKREYYDSKFLIKDHGYPKKPCFYKSNRKLEIEDLVDKENRIWEKIKSQLLFLRKKRKTKVEIKKKLEDEDLSSFDKKILYKGEYLKKVRESRGVSLEEIARATKLKGDLLKALEEEDYESLPKDVYLSFIIKIYAQYLGLNP